MTVMSLNCPFFMKSVSPTRETNIPSDMHSSTQEAHISGYGYVFPGLTS